MGRASKKQKVPSSESEPEVDEDFEDEQEYDEDAILAAHPQDDLDDVHRDAEILQSIQGEAEKAEEGEQLTWNAIYSLKKQEGQLSVKMAEEIEAIRERYELLKQPLFQQISQVALGVKVDSKLYRPEGLPCRGDPSKTAPKPIPDFWGVVLENQGLISNEVDVECFSKVKELTCELLDHKTNHLRIRFRFSAPTQYFSNLDLQVETKLDTEGVPSREIKEEIKYKGERKEDSVFTMLFDSKTEVHESYGFASELYRDYTSALYFYFKDEEEEDGEEGDEEDGEEEDGEEEDEEVEAVQKPKKKGKKEETKKDPLQKPDCKQQ